MVLYPGNGEAWDDEVMLHGHRVRFVTVDLMAEWRAIERRLFELVGAA